MKGAAIAGATGGAAVPVVWDFLGYRFEAGPLIVTICAALMTRLIVTLNHKHNSRVVLDVLVTLLSILVSVLWVQANSLGLLPAGMMGITFGALGIGIIGLAKSQVAVAFKAALPVFLRGMADSTPARGRVDRQLRQSFPVPRDTLPDEQKLLGQLPDDTA